MERVFLLSPAHCGGERARLIFRPEASFELARRVRSEGGAPLGEVFSFLSGLYFRGKLAYARAFARPPEGEPGLLVITPNRGLVQADEPVGLARLRSFARVDIHEDDPRYARPLLRAATSLRGRLGSDAELVLLGSIATGKYRSLLGEVFGERLLFPSDFVGRGDMSRGGLMLRAARSGQELAYVPVAGAALHGARPPRLPRLAGAPDAARSRPLARPPEM